MVRAIVLNSNDTVATLIDRVGIDSFVRNRNALVPMRRTSDAWDIAHAALYIASNEAK